MTDTIPFARPAAAPPGWGSVANLYHGLFTGLMLRVALHRGAADAGELARRIFRRQHHQRFLPGLKKLGLDRLPHAVAAASYHYLSNRIGGVIVEFMPESDRKAWVRFPPPRWAWRDIAICGIPSEVSVGMLRGWQAHNGVSLGNPRLGFVCTGQTPDGDPGLEGYFQEYDHDLAPEDRLRFARHEQAPPFDPALAPDLDPADWPPIRLAKAHRAYAMEYVRSAWPETIQLFGGETARFLAGGGARLVGLQLFQPLAEVLGTEGGFGAFLVRLAEAQGDTATVSGDAFEMGSWRLMQGVEPHPMLAEIWTCLLQGLGAAFDRDLVVTRAGPTAWRLSKR